MADEEKNESKSSAKGLPKGLLEAVKAQIFSSNAVVGDLNDEIANAKSAKERETLQNKLKRVTEMVNALKDSDLEIASTSKNGKTFVVHAGNYGLRKVELK